VPSKSRVAASLVILATGCTSAAEYGSATQAGSVSPTESAPPSVRTSTTAPATTRAAPTALRVSAGTTRCSRVWLPKRGVGEADYGIDRARGLLDIHFGAMRGGRYRNIAYTVAYLADPSCRTTKAVADLIDHVGPPGWEAQALPRARFCRFEQVLVSVGRGREPAMQQWVAGLQITNVSHTACRVMGYPSGGLLDMRGRVAVPLHEGGGVQLRQFKPNTLRLPPGWSAFFGIDKSVCQTHTASSTFLRVRMPRQTAATTVRIPRTSYCLRKGDKGHRVHVSPLRRSLNAVFRL
jgi:hypothetical protein